MTPAESMTAFSISQLGCRYVFGSLGQLCTPSYLLSISPSTLAAHPTIIGGCQRLNGQGAPSCAGCQYEGRCCWDCRGLVRGAVNAAGIKIRGSGATDQYNTASNWDLRGDIADMPARLVCAVYRRRKRDGRMEHTAVYLGDGTTVEASVGVVRRGLAAGHWTHFAIPKGVYTWKELYRVDTPIKIIGTAIIQTRYDAGLSLYGDPDKTTEIIDVRKNETVDVYDKQAYATNGALFVWCGYGGKQGYANSKYLSAVTPVVAPETAQEKMVALLNAMIDAIGAEDTAHDATKKAAVALREYLVKQG